MTSENKDSFFAFVKAYPHYRRIITSRLLGILTARMLFTIMGWEIYRITNDPLFIGLLGLFEVVPAILTGLFAGNAIDTLNRKKIVLAVAMLNVFTISVLALLNATLAENLIPYAFLGFSLCTGFLRSFWGATLSAMIPNIIPIEKVPRSGPYTTGAFLLGSVVGHALGGFLIGYVSITLSILLGAIWFLICCLELSKLPNPKTPLKRNTGVIQNIAEGIGYVYQNKIILSAITLDMFAVLFGGLVALLPVYARDILFISPVLFGWLNASMDIGALVGIATMALFPMQKRQGRTLLISVFFFGVGIVAFAFSRNYVLSMAILVVCGFCDSISMVVRGIIMQSYVPDHIRGRVMSVNSIFISSSNELGQFESGVTSRLMGVIPATIFGGSMTLLVVVIIALFSPKLRNLEWKVE